MDRAALEAVLLRVSEMACELPELEELDINPLIADESGVVAVDARVVLRAVPAQRTPYAHLAIHPYPRDLERRLWLRGGAQVTLRPIRPEERPWSRSSSRGSRNAAGTCASCAR